MPAHPGIFRAEELGLADPPIQLRDEIGEQLIVVVPGIRPVENRPADDQKRIVSVTQAFRNGADYIVVGRPILRAANPRTRAMEIQQEIAAVFAVSINCSLGT